MLDGMLETTRPARQRAGRCLFYATIAGVLAGPGTAIGAPAPGGGPPITIRVPNRIVLPSILPQEILLGSDVRNVGGAAAGLDLGAPTVDAGLDATAGAALGINPEVVRQVQELWSVRIPPQAPGIPAVAVDYRLTSPLGAPGVLGLTSQPTTTVDVVVQDLGTRIVRHGQGQGQGQGRQDIVGDVEFRFQSASLVAAGRYSGDLLITVTFL